MSDRTSLTLAEIRPKMELKGVVKRIELAGAVIDVGAEADALLHISQIQAGHVKNVGDHLQEGQEVTVWVRNVDASRGQLNVTLIKPPAVGWAELAVGQVHVGKVVRIEKFGVFVDIGAEKPGLVHVSELAAGYVSNPSDVVETGAEVEVKVIGLNRRKNQIDLSIKQLAAPAARSVEKEEAETEDLPTAMALAMQRALGKEAPAEKDRGSGRRRSEKDDRQEDILRRTLHRLENQ